MEPLGPFLVPFSTVLDAVRPPAGSSVARKLPNPCNTRVWEGPGREEMTSGGANEGVARGTKQQTGDRRNREPRVAPPEVLKWGSRAPLNYRLETTGTENRGQKPRTEYL